MTAASKINTFGPLVVSISGCTQRCVVVVGRLLLLLLYILFARLETRILIEIEKEYRLENVNNHYLKCFFYF